MIAERIARYGWGGSVPPELNQPGLTGMQFQPELREPLTKLRKEPLRILLMLETRDKVVREPHDDHIPVRVAAPPPLSP
jgi:hypothetical protein